MQTAQDPQRYVAAIRKSNLTIHDPIEIGDPDLWIPSSDLQSLLNSGLRGDSLGGLPLRTRSKAVKQKVCEILGYPTPPSFPRVRPRFPGQLFDIYTQKSDNLQIWNEDIVPSRRYVIVRISNDGIIVGVKVVTGDVLARLDTTGTLTKKHQARVVPGPSNTELLTAEDTSAVMPFVKKNVVLGKTDLPTSHPVAGELLPISEIFGKLSSLVETKLPDPGADQERSRGAALHLLVCKTLGYESCPDDGRFPDIRHQLLEMKLQTSRVINLGIVRPDSREALDITTIGAGRIRHCDVRYAIFYGVTDRSNITLTHFFMSTGEGFFDRFPEFQSKESNRKLQLRLPGDFFSG